MTTEKTYNMRQPDSIYTRSQVVFDKRTFSIQTTNQRAKIDVPVNAKICRVLRKDAVWSPRTRSIFSNVSRATTQAEIPGFSVINRVQNVGESKYEFFKNYWFVGLATDTMEAHAIKTDTDIRTAVDIQGRTWMQNNGPGLIKAGDKIMLDIDDNLASAQRRLQGLPHADDRGEIPDNRFTAFPTVWKIEEARDGIVGDWDQFMRDRTNTFPSTPSAVINLRRMAAMGALLFFGYADQNNQPADTGTFITDVSTALQNPAAVAGAPQLVNLLNGIRNGTLDNAIAALLMPTAQERVIRVPIVPSGTDRNVVYVHGIQLQGARGLLHAVDAAIGDAGRNRVIGHALTNGKPGSQFGILLTG